MDSETVQSQYLALEGAKEGRDSLLKLSSLKTKKQFELAGKNPKFFVNDSFKILSSLVTDYPTQDETILIGFKITKKIAASVGRNKLRRQIKSIFRNLLRLDKRYFSPNQAFIIIAKKPIIEKTFSQLNIEISAAIRFLYKKLKT
jgi:ribonuclease P protein component